VSEQRTSGPIEQLERHRAFDGWNERYRHQSESTGTPMCFSLYRPPQAASARVPVLYFLAGLTCTDETFLAKAGAQRWAAEAGLMLVAPDTSPRGAGIAGEDADWEVGVGAGFYLDAVTPAWSAHYRMERYLTNELPALLRAHFPVDERESVFGHSMGGHGALVLALRHPQRYRSVSAFAPICAPSQVPWGEKAFTKYLGTDRSSWAAYDASELVRAGAAPWLPLLVEQGEDDKFLSRQLRPELLVGACTEAGHPLELRRRPGYDHSYSFIATYVKDHIEHHARALG
jgi:S-formylglutathione hydrolase